ncbi:RNA polymerase factor sigma-54 [Propionispira raffinosivorans]|uniref:RNA polymerase factor sigma-54 n=1 Tax=Propionispira raffinosivorans TaxID=86959 RepID=UPI00035DF203|nr:RNA polymerase factor sigma-54 [Propionispira raffinosivorans]
MEQSLSLNLGQKLAMTAKLQQAIQILQLSSQDLCTMIENEYLENPALEMDESFSETDVDEKTTDRYSIEDIANLANYLGDERPGKVIRDDTNQSFEVMEVSQNSLVDILIEQVNFTFSKKEEHQIAEYIVGSIDDCGYLRISCAEIAIAMQVNEAAVEIILEIIQTFDPAGVGARDLKECLMIQAKQQDIYQGLIAAVIDKHLDAVASAQFKMIAEKENCSPNDVQAAVDIIRKLNPKPGSSYGGRQSDYIVPDVVVRKIDDEYIVLVNQYGTPKLNISSTYKNGVNFDHDTKKYIEQRVNSAAWLIKSIEQRRMTLFNVVTEIVRLQKEFFDKGTNYLRPMLMKTIAENVNVHESTVSRAVANKYVETPHGVVPLKKFFTANLGSVMEGEELIASQVKMMLKQMIEEEDCKKPFSDQQLSDMLKAKNMNISRRTVMKYREQLGFLSSVKRKRY